MSNIQKKTYFISDLHLDESRPQLTKLLFNFLDDIQNKAEALYILGDLFEAWIGDDVIDHPMGKYYLPIIDKLKSLSDSGINLYFMQGNRDFLAQDKFVKKIGAKLLPDQLIIDLYGTQTLIMHGDTLCIDDKGYQRMRAIFRLKIVQKIYLSLSLKSRAEKAQKIRKTSKRKTRLKDEMILDVNQKEVTKQLKRGEVTLLIHGHTHRPAIHSFEVECKETKRIVLGDWRDKSTYLEVSQGNFNLVY